MDEGIGIYGPMEDRFKRARTTLGLTQKSVAKILAVSQSQISDYERGVGGLDEVKVHTLEQLVREKQEELDRITLPPVIFRPESEARPTSLYSDEDFSRHVRATVASWKLWKEEDSGSTCNIYLLGSSDEDLPILNEPAIETLWAENLGAGVNYHLFWVLDGTTSRDLEDAFGTLSDVVSRAVEQSGPANSDHLKKIHVRGIILASREYLRGVTEAYDNLRKVSDRVDLCKLQDLSGMDEKTLSTWLPIVRQSGTSPTLLCKISRSPPVIASSRMRPPKDFAAKREVNVAFAPDDAPFSTGWLFLNKKTTSTLVEHLGIASDEGGLA